ESVVCPWRRASSRRFGVARSVRSPASAMREPPRERAEDRLELAEARREEPEGEGQRGPEHHEADADGEREADDEDVQLRDRPGEDAERRVGQEERDHHRRRDPDAGREDVAREADDGLPARRARYEEAGRRRAEALDERPEEDVVRVEREEEKE